MFNFFSIQLSNFHDMDFGFDGLTWFDRLAQLILGNPSIFFFYLVIKL